MTERKVGEGIMRITLDVGKKLNLKDINRNTVLFLVSEVKRLLRSPESVRRSEKRKSKSSREISFKRDVRSVVRSTESSRRQSKERTRTTKGRVREKRYDKERFERRKN